MLVNISLQDFRDYGRIKSDFTYEGAEALFDFIEENYPDTEQNPNDWAIATGEHDSAEAAAEDLGYDSVEELEDSNTVVHFDSGVLIIE